MPKSRMDHILEKEVSVTMPVTLWVTIQQAVSTFDMRKVDPRLVDEYQAERIDILKRLEKMFDKEWPSR